MRKRLVAGLVLSSAGCGAPSLKDVKPLEIVLVVEPKAAPSLAVSVGDCREVDVLEASIDGKAVPNVSRGKNSDSFETGFDPPTCRAPGFQTSDAQLVPPADRASSVITLKDASKTVTLELAHPTTPHTLRVVEPADGKLVPGQLARVAIEPGDNVGDFTAKTSTPPVLDFRPPPGTGSSTEAWRVDASQGGLIQQGSELRFTVPASAVPATGTLNLIGPLPLHFTRCEGADTCTGFDDHTFDAPLSGSAAVGP